MFFFHYLLDKNRFRQNALAHNKKFAGLPTINSVDLSSEDVKKIMTPEVVSCIYNNFLGETLYVGDVRLMQELDDKIKAGFESTEEILGQLTRSDFVENGMRRTAELVVYDLVKEPKYTQHKR